MTAPSIDQVYSFIYFISWKCFLEVFSDKVICLSKRLRHAF